MEGPRQKGIYECRGGVGVQEQALVFVFQEEEMKNVLEKG